MEGSERVEAATRSMVDSDPSLADDLSALLEVDAEGEPWTFDDIPLDSGQFGEVVSEGIAESVDDGGYRLTDTAAVARALDESPPSASATGSEPTTPEDGTPSSRDVPLSLPASAAGVWETVGQGLSARFAAVDRTAALAVAFLLVLFGTVRSLFYAAVFRDGMVVSPANDPYFYRYWQRQFLERSGSATDLGMLATIGQENTRRPLTQALNWWFAALTGGTPGAADAVAAWAPVLAAIAGGGLLYLLACELTGDRRIGLGAVLLLAFTPVHVVYTSLGFLEHRPYQYFWLLLLAFGLVWLAAGVRRRHASVSGREAARAHLRSPDAWGISGLVAVAVGASAHTWGGSPLTFVPVALYVAVRVVSDVRHDVPPLLANLPALVGIGAGAVLAQVAHRSLGWHEPIAAAVPVLVALGGIGVALVATAWRRFDRRAATLLATEVLLAGVGLWAYTTLRPSHIARLRDRADDLFNREVAIETASLFGSGGFDLIYQPLAQLGIGFFLGLVPLLALTWYATRAYAPGWLVMLSFTWLYFLLATVQIRFAAQFSLFLALFAAIALVYVLGALELVRPPTVFATPDRPTGEDSKPGTASAIFEPESDAGDGDAEALSLPDDFQSASYLLSMVVLFLLLNLLFVPTLLGQIQYDDAEVAATTSVASHAENHPDHPQYVLSHWGDNRMHNFFVNGDSQSYGYARSKYGSFVTADDPDVARQDLRGSVGYVILTDHDLEHAGVHEALFANRGAGEASTAHFQLLYTAGDVRAFAVVPGAELVVPAGANDPVTASLNLTVSGEQLAYERTATANADGQARIRVAYPGTYEVGDRSVTVSEAAVYAGEVIDLRDGS